MRCELERWLNDTDGLGGSKPYHKSLSFLRLRVKCYTVPDSTTGAGHETLYYF
jgi:hypothetical protein